MDVDTAVDTDLLKQTLEAVTNLVCLCREGSITYINTAGVSLLGALSKDQVLGRALADFVPSEYGDLMRADMGAFAEDANGTPLKIHSLDGSVRDAVLSVTPLEGEPGTFIVEVRDISDFLRAAHETQQQELKLRRIFESVADGIVAIDGRGIIHTFNPAAEAIFGYRATEVIGQSIDLFIPEQDKGFHGSAIKDYRKRGHSDVVDNTRDFQARRKDGTIFTAEIRVTEIEEGRHRNFIATIRDVTEKRAQEEKIRRLAHHDILTGLPNRALLKDRLNRAVARAHRQEIYLALMYVDLDKFKPINDLFGHDAGDDVLRGVAGRLVSSVRGTDTVARVGGDEFVVLIESLNAPEEAGKIADKILTLLLAPFRIKGADVHIGASIGISLFPVHGEAPETLMKRADEAMYKVKGAGRNSFVYAEGASLP
ncbi:diguanylate cyclase domain-containing protein [Magnetospira sp. QH-2]|uniref:diguanylate cyclase domain-containing protein n=1 Tax=Magnetospira sp. (strain QH-2) TaxID=1288970 RepID=UPI0003E80C92|nr:diguanylate cyclase [Magnetospira sp. QH-2]CCQ72099.1 putative response (PAS/PAC N-terminal domain; Diguanylate kinase C-terminal domain) [Magnetospira sp. QH-2]